MIARIHAGKNSLLGMGLNVSYSVSTKEKLCPCLSLAPSRCPPREAADYLNGQGFTHGKVYHKGAGYCLER